MATRVISTSIKLDGEAEFKKQLSQVNGELKNLKSDMQLVTAEFDGQANSLEALTAKDKILRSEMDQQEEKVRALTRALEEATDAYGEGDKRVDAYHRQLNQAKTELVKMGRELEDNNRYLEEAKRNSDRAAHSIDGFGKEVKDAAKDVDTMGGSMKDFLGKVGGLKTAIMGGAVVGGAIALKNAVMDITESTAEYRKVMGTLEVSSQKAGYNAEQTSYAYERLYGVLGDSQTAATTLANLQAIGLSQGQLLKMIEATTGAWATYGDSIPIDGLAESINETIQAGKVTGVFADVLNWAGDVMEDDFNAALEKATTSSERQNLVLQYLADQGLMEAGKGWREANADIVKMNEAQADWEAATGRLGTVLAPAATALVNFGADAVEYVTDLVIKASEAIEDFIGWFQKMSKEVDSVDEWSGAPTWGFDGSLAVGLSYVPYDGYIAQLHKGETVLTANEAANLRRMMAEPDRVRGGVTAGELQSVVAAAVNAVGAGQSMSGTNTIEVNLVVNGKKFYQETIEDLRFVEKSNPEARNDI